MSKNKLQAHRDRGGRYRVYSKGGFSESLENETIPGPWDGNQGWWHTFGERIDRD